MKDEDQTCFMKIVCSPYMHHVYWLLVVLEATRLIVGSTSANIGGLLLRSATSFQLVAMHSLIGMTHFSRDRR